MHWRVLAAVALAVGGLAVSPPTGDASTGTPPGTAGSGSATVRVILEAGQGGVGSAGQVARELGGTVVSTQETLDTLVVDVPKARIRELGATTAVASVTQDSQVTLQSGGLGPTGLAGDMQNVARITGATTFWRNGYSGQGVDVAVLDSGVLPVQGLMTPNKLVIGPDLSFESQLPNLRHLDTFGHGTHISGIIAGRDSGTGPLTYATDSSKFTGMAPGARVVSIKLADAQGNTDVSQVIAAIDWVVAHSRDAGMNIRVLNLSFGTDSSQDYRLDPLAHAAEVAWSKGIVVVASAGNSGSSTGLANPAYDPAVLAVGAQDTRGTADPSDDVVPAFSQRGAVAAGLRAPDLVAPGVSVVSLRAPSSFIDTTFGATGVVGERFFKGSGTSQSAAVVSGSAALLLSQRPGLSPDQVKDVLRRSARPVAGFSEDAQGAGALDLDTAFSTSARSARQAKVHTGGGSLDKARGRFKVKWNGKVLDGEQDIFGRTVDTSATEPTSEVAPEAFGTSEWGGGSWTGSPAMGATWAGATWAGATWAGATWAGATWAGATWAGASWAGATWTGSDWEGATWAGATWAGATWANDLWSSAGWE
jgi:serine protease AprX